MRVNTTAIKNFGEKMLVNTRLFTILVKIYLENLELYGIYLYKYVCVCVCVCIILHRTIFVQLGLYKKLFDEVWNEYLLETISRKRFTVYCLFCVWPRGGALHVCVCVCVCVCTLSKIMFISVALLTTVNMAFLGPQHVGS